MLIVIQNLLTDYKPRIGLSIVFAQYELARKLEDRDDLAQLAAANRTVWNNPQICHSHFLIKDQQPILFPFYLSRGYYRN